MKAETESAIREFIATAEGWCTVEKALEMAQLVIDAKAERCLQIGVFAGGSLIPQALALQEQGHGRIIAVDPWKKADALIGENQANQEWWKSVDLNKMHVLTMEAIWQYGLDRRVLIVRSTSSDYYSACQRTTPSYDIVEIDGNHSEEISTQDVKLWLPTLAPEGYCWMDDCQWPSTQKAVAMLDAECNLVRDHESYRLYQKR